jgi:hypothetical protein
MALDHAWTGLGVDPAGFFDWIAVFLNGKTAKHENPDKFCMIGSKPLKTSDGGGHPASKANASRLDFAKLD